MSLINSKQRFKHIRKRAGMTQDELISKLYELTKEEIDLKKLSWWERGQSQPQLNIIIAYCKIFNTNYCYLLGMTEIDAPLDSYEVKYRLPKGKTNKELAMLTNSSEYTIAKYVKNAKNLITSPNNLSKFANAFGYSVDYFLGFSNYQTWNQYAVENRKYDYFKGDCVFHITPMDPNSTKPLSNFIENGRYVLLSEDRRYFVFSNNILIPVSDPNLIQNFNIELTCINTLINE